MKQEDTYEIYSSMEKVWPDDSHWYDYTHKNIIKFVETMLEPRLKDTSKYLNAGSGGSTYKLKGTCYHLDIAENLIKNFPNHYVSSVEKMPFNDGFFDAIICVGSVLNYCSALESIQEIVRVLKPNGFLVLEFERSNTAELWLSREYGKASTLQNYEYLGHIHSLWLYSEKYVKELLTQNGLTIKKYKRFHCISALINRLSAKEEFAGKFGKLDLCVYPVSRFMAHNMILFCQKGKS